MEKKESVEPLDDCVTPSCLIIFICHRVSHLIQSENCWQPYLRLCVSFSSPRSTRRLVKHSQFMVPFFNRLHIRGKNHLIIIIIIIIILHRVYGGTVTAFFLHYEKKNRKKTSNADNVKLLNYKKKQWKETIDFLHRIFTTANWRFKYSQTGKLQA